VIIDLVGRWLSDNVSYVKEDVLRLAEISESVL